MRTEPCKSCGAEMVWAEIDGKRVPLNKRRVRVYRAQHESLGDGFEEVRGNDGKAALFHISHFITCPHAAEHSKGGRRGQA